MKHAGTVCVIGAGPSGLTTIKALSERNIPCHCFEKDDRVGGLWTIGKGSGKTSAYRSLRINTSRAKMQFSDFPIPETLPEYLHHTEVASYFESYTEHFGLERHIRFDTEVTRAESAEGGRWKVTLAGGESRTYAALCVANGHHTDPHWPTPAITGSFAGPEIHSRDYLDPNSPLALRGKRVLVVGMGNSAMDIACELAESGDCRVYLSARRGAFILPKWVLGKPVDQSSLLPRFIPSAWRRRISERLLRFLVGRMEDHGLPKPDHGLGGAHPTISDDLLRLIAREGSDEGGRTDRERGCIVPKPAIKRFEGQTAYFNDESCTEVDAVVYCTGYNVRFPFFDDGFIHAPNNDLPLFMRVHKPGIDNLFFIGLCQTVGAVMPVAEAQARWVADQLSGDYLLPDATSMSLHMAQERRELFAPRSG